MTIEPESYAVDAIDLRILDVLQEDASLAVAEIAERVSLSQNACWRRIKRLEEEGVILRRVALLDPRRLRAGVTVFMTLGAAEHSDAWFATLTQAVARIPEIVEAHRLTGTSDYLLKVQVSDLGAFDRVYKRLIRSVRLARVESAVALEKIKYTTAIPLTAA